ncbi:MAG: hypothetical protein JSR48_13595 [Verrucomicrobia bacterium]|nr:hypothetical protein [Verrucomicrobiota bacterium]
MVPVGHTVRRSGKLGAQGGFEDFSDPLLPRHGQAGGRKLLQRRKRHAILRAQANLESLGMQAV